MVKLEKSKLQKINADLSFCQNIDKSQLSGICKVNHLKLNGNLKTIFSFGYIITVSFIYGDMV